MQYESDVIQLLQQAINLSQEEISELLDIPPNENLGDIAFPCFKLSKMYKKSPLQIAHMCYNNMCYNVKAYREKDL